MILISRYIVPKGYTGIAIFPFVFLKARCLKENQILINHENIHLRQQLELLVLPFYVVYILEFLVRWMHIIEIGTKPIRTLLSKGMLTQMKSI